MLGGSANHQSPTLNDVFDLGELINTSEFLSTSSLLCRKFALICRETTTFYPPDFVTHDTFTCLAVA